MYLIVHLFIFVLVRLFLWVGHKFIIIVSRKIFPQTSFKTEYKSSKKEKLLQRMKSSTSPKWSNFLFNGVPVFQ